MAVAVEDHQDICYVGHDKSVQRRAVKVAQAPPRGHAGSPRQAQRGRRGLPGPGASSLVGPPL